MINYKDQIDHMTYKHMLSLWRYTPVGGNDLLFEGETGEYFSKSMAEKKKYVDHVAISKIVGWRD